MLQVHLNAGERIDALNHFECKTSDRQSNIVPIVRVNCRKPMDQLILLLRCIYQGSRLLIFFQLIENTFGLFQVVQYGVGQTDFNRRINVAPPSQCVHLASNYTNSMLKAAPLLLPDLLMLYTLQSLASRHTTFVLFSLVFWLLLPPRGSFTIFCHFKKQFEY